MFITAFLVYNVSMRQLGIFSGSFDPVHEGHVAFAQEAMKVCGLETVVFMPERFPRGKPNVTPVSERLTELEITLANTPFIVLDAHADQFTVDETLTELEALYPDTHLTFLVGSDVALGLKNWPNIGRLAQYTFAVGLREGDTQHAASQALKSLLPNYVIVKTQYPHLSSRTLRHHQSVGRATRTNR